jgi:serine/threonine protein kinase
VTDPSGPYAPSSGNVGDVTLRELAPGVKLFNRYKLIKTLGRGGMGVVWLARDDELEREVALKFLPDLIIHDRAVLSDLRRETRRSLELTHKNIVRIYDFIHDDTTGCISMEYIDGDTLSNLRADKSTKVFETSELEDWTAQLCDALEYAHNHARVIHRDLKPANLMVNQRGDLKIADFGIARSLSDSVSALTVGNRGKSGTLVYMSPQQLDGERGNHLDDVYSFGATMYELLTSKPPFSSGNVDRQIREKVPPSLTQRRKELEVKAPPVDEKWERTVAACLAKDPTRRPQSIAQVANRLELAAPGTRSSTAIYSKPPENKMFITLGIMVVGLIGAATWYFAVYKPGQVESSAAAPALATPPASQPAVVPPAPIATTAPKPLGSVMVDTSPSRATITLDGKQLMSPATFAQIPPGKYPMRIDLDGYERFEQQVEVKEGSNNFGTITLQRVKQPPEAARAPAGPKVIPNTVYEGAIRVKYDSSVATRQLTITVGSDTKSGTMTQSSKKGDVVVKFAGVWEEATLRAVTNEVISQPAGTKWEPEYFSLRFSEDGKSATYECNAGGKTYVADLSTQSFGSPIAARLSPVYKGTITGGTALTISFAGDRKSGTMTERSKSGDVVVKFTGIWNGSSSLSAVTGDVISKPPKVKWVPEFFTLRFSEDGRTGSYECTADGRLYTAQLSAP